MDESLRSNISPTMLRLSGFSELVLLTGIPNQSCHVPCVLLELRLGAVWVDLVSLPKSGE